MAETNAFLAYPQVYNVKSDTYGHSDWRQDLVVVLMREVEWRKGGAAQGDVGESVDHGHKVPIASEFAPHWWT